MTYSCFALPSRLEKLLMNGTQTHVEDRACPTGFVLLPAVIGTVVWLCVILSRLSH